jgi:hypothetical protein
MLLFLTGPISLEVSRPLPTFTARAIAHLPEKGFAISPVATAADMQKPAQKILALTPKSGFGL